MLCVKPITVWYYDRKGSDSVGAGLINENIAPHNELIDARVFFKLLTKKIEFG